MPAASDRPTLVAALHDVWDHLLELGESLTDAQWKTETENPRWTVQDNYSHIIGTELMLLGRPDPTIDLPDDSHLRNDIARFNEMSIEPRRRSAGAEVLAEFRAVADERRKLLGVATDEEFDAESFTPAGKDTYGRFMQIRTMDCWMHEQDCRAALGISGHIEGPAVSVALDEIVGATGYVVGKKAGATDGQSVRLELTGPDTRTIDVRVDGRAQIVDDLDDPTVTITMPVLLWTRVAGGRRPGRPDDPAITIVGDRDLGERVITNAAYMI